MKLRFAGPKKENTMSKSRIGPEAKIVNLFSALSDDGKRIVLDVIKSQSAPPRKVSTKKALANAPAPLPADKEAKCGICGNEKDHADHDRIYLSSHDFEPPKSVARVPRKSRLKSEEQESVQGSEIVLEDPGVAALAARAGE